VGEDLSATSIVVKALELYLIEEIASDSVCLLSYESFAPIWTRSPHHLILPLFYAVCTKSLLALHTLLRL